MKILNIGFGNFIFIDKIVSIVSPESAPIKRIIQNSKENTMLIDATCGKKTKAVVIMNSGHVVLSNLQVETLGHRLTNEPNYGDDCNES